MAPCQSFAVHESVEDEEYYQVLNSIQDALKIVENSTAADDVVRQRLKTQLRELRLGLLSLLEPKAEEHPQPVAPSEPS